jgi:hypothetical protein
MLETILRMEVAEALPLLDQSYRISRDLDDSEALLFVVYCLAWALALGGRAADAARVYSRAEVLLQATDRSAMSWLERERNTRPRESMPSSTKALSRGRGTRDADDARRGSRPRARRRRARCLSAVGVE